MSIPRLNPLSVSELSSLSSLKFIQGDSATSFNQVSASSNPRPGSLVFISNPLELPAAISAKPAVMVLSQKLSSSEVPMNIAVFSSNSISESMVQVLSKMELPSSIQGISASAKINPSAKIGKNVKIGEYVVIEEDAVVGDNSVLQHHVIVEARAKVGENTILHPQVVIGHDCIVGSFVEIQSHSQIGRDGFGYHTDKAGFHHKIPQVGITVIEDYVEMGAHCSVDRATLTETRIGKNSKLDNFIHIAHNCQIGPHSRLAGGFMMAGSSKAGANLLTGGSVVVTDHVELADGVTLAGRSTVTNDIPKPGAYGGYPLEPLRDALRSLTNITKISEIRKQLNEVRKHLGLKDQSKDSQ